MIDFSIILPTTCRFGMLKMCINSIKKNSVNKNHEIICVFDTVVKSSNREFKKPIYKEYIDHYSPIIQTDLLDFLKENNCVILEPKEFGDHYRMTNYGADFCTKDYIVLGHNDIYFMKDWDKGPIELIESNLIQEKNFICPNALPDHSQCGGIQHLQIIEAVKGKVYDWWKNGEYFVDEDFINSFGRFSSSGSIFEATRKNHWVCPLILHKNLFNKVGRYNTTYLMPHDNDLNLDIELHKIGGCYVPNNSWIWHL